MVSRRVGTGQTATVFDLAKTLDDETSKVIKQHLRGGFAIKMWGATFFSFTLSVGLVVFPCNRCSTCACVPPLPPPKSRFTYTPPRLTTYTGPRPNFQNMRVFGQIDSQIGAEQQRRNQLLEHAASTRANYEAQRGTEAEDLKQWENALRCVGVDNNVFVAGGGKARGTPYIYIYISYTMSERVPRSTVLTLPLNYLLETSREAGEWGSFPLTVQVIVRVL